MWVAFANAKCTLIFIFSKNISVNAVFNYQTFNDTLTNDIVSFEQLGPEFFDKLVKWSSKSCKYQCPGSNTFSAILYTVKV